MGVAGLIFEPHPPGEWVLSFTGHRMTWLPKSFLILPFPSKFWVLITFFLKSVGAIAPTLKRPLKWIWEAYCVSDLKMFFSKMPTNNGLKKCSQRMFPKNVPKECPEIMSSWQNLTHPKYIQKRMTNPLKGAPRACRFTVHSTYS